MCQFYLDNLVEPAFKVQDSWNTGSVGLGERELGCGGSQRADDPADNLSERSVTGSAQNQEH